MSKPLLILAAAAAAWALWVEYGDRLPQGVTYRPSGDGLDTPVGQTCGAPGTVSTAPTAPRIVVVGVSSRDWGSVVSGLPPEQAASSNANSSIVNRRNAFGIAVNSLARRTPAALMGTLPLVVA